jgi:hypothetical protein
MTFEPRVPFCFETSRNDAYLPSKTPVAQVMDNAQVQSQLDFISISGPTSVDKGKQNVKFCATNVPPVVNGETTTYAWSIKTNVGSAVIDGPTDEQCVSIDYDAGNYGTQVIQCVITNSESPDSPLTLTYTINVLDT